MLESHFFSTATPAAFSNLKTTSYSSIKQKMSYFLSNCHARKKEKVTYYEQLTYPFWLCKSWTTENQFLRWSIRTPLSWGATVMFNRNRILLNMWLSRDKKEKWMNGKFVLQEILSMSIKLKTLRKALILLSTACFPFLRFWIFTWQLRRGMHGTQHDKVVLIYT